MAAQVETYKTILSEFIDLYRSMPCLWKVRSKEYADRNKKERAYDVLANKLRQVDPRANREKVVKKINNIRSSFRKELKKYQTSKQANPDEVYTPRLWYYDSLLFLTDQDQDQDEDMTISNQSPSAPLHDEQDLMREFDEDDSESKEDPFSLLNVSVLPTEFNDALPPDTTDLKITEHEIVEEKKPEISSISSKRLGSAREEDEFDIIAKNIGNKLRKLTPFQVLVTEKRINDILFEAQMENLQTHSNRYGPQYTGLTESIKVEIT